MLAPRLTRKLVLFSSRRWMCANAAAAPHVPVMAAEMIKYFEPSNGELYIDMTFGAGGHSREILKVAPKAKIIALDRDPQAYAMAKEMADEFPGRIIPLLGRFSELPELLDALKIYQRTIDGMIFDFGCSSMQFDSASRGFAISKDGPLDMRMDRDRYPNEPTAAEIIAKIDEKDLAMVLKTYGEEKHAKKIARAIIETRYSMKKIETTKDLADVVQACLSREARRVDKLHRPIHPATKTFQAIRILVNNELNEIDYGLMLAERYLKLGGRLVAISFHSLEDTIVKRHLMGNAADDESKHVPLKYKSYMMSHEQDVMQEMMSSNWHQLTDGVVVPSYDEVENNPRSRSSKLRAAALVNYSEYN